MADVETCAFCGKQAAVKTMDMTGLGWRCPPCNVQAMIKPASENHMAENLTVLEIEAVLRSANREAALGALSLAGGIGIAAVGFVGRVFGLLVLGGLAGLSHGLYRRKLAREALRDAPSARVV